MEYIEDEQNHIAEVPKAMHDLSRHFTEISMFQEYTHKDDPKWSIEKDEEVIRWVHTLTANGISNIWKRKDCRTNFKLRWYDKLNPKFKRT